MRFRWEEGNPVDLRPLIDYADPVDDDPVVGTLKFITPEATPMPIVSSRNQWFNPVSVSDTTPAQNGGRPSQTQNVSGVKNNLFPDVSAAQRQAGAEHWRKVFVQIKNADNLPLIDPKISIEQGTPQRQPCAALSRHPGPTPRRRAPGGPTATARSLGRCRHRRRPRSP
ncbi:MAG: hypothetical protein MZV65_00920 [Chromatiales bacterium]|nr:hypothetical protein [Chromatiales bacterium]